MKQPILTISKTQVDKAINLVCFILLLILFGLPIFYYSILPDRIPIHFRAQGQVDRYDEKIWIFLAPSLGLITYLGLRILILFPHKFNYWVTITKDNAYYQYKNAIRMLRILNVIILTSLTYLNYMIIRVALGFREDIGFSFILTMIIISFGVIFTFQRASLKNK
ncbi:DUF1648 domain-containing protein [Membranihabitans marinus]|uniref:DUF1648 domain-containing protein n=1 Tax=Membranihabitans marinus TaxID=1227546 RepID=UPI001F1B5503|nr:DUF1648 domain-containing protein [Membranihabitans marinus]